MAHQFSKPMKVLLVGGMNYQGGTVSALKFAPTPESHNEVVAAPVTANGEVGGSGQAAGFLSPRVQNGAGERDEILATDTFEDQDAQLNFLTKTSAVVAEEKRPATKQEEKREVLQKKKDPFQMTPLQCQSAYLAFCHAHEQGKNAVEKDRWNKVWMRADPYLTPFVKHKNGLALAAKKCAETPSSTGDEVKRFINIKEVKEHLDVLQKLRDDGHLGDEWRAGRYLLSIPKYVRTKRPETKWFQGQGAERCDKAESPWAKKYQFQYKQEKKLEEVTAEERSIAEQQAKSEARKDSKNPEPLIQVVGQPVNNDPAALVEPTAPAIWRHADYTGLPTPVSHPKSFGASETSLTGGETQNPSAASAGARETGAGTPGGGSPKKMPTVPGQQPFSDVKSHV